MQFCTPGLLHAVPWPQSLLCLGRTLEDDGVVEVALVRLLDLEHDSWGYKEGIFSLAVQ